MKITKVDVSRTRPVWADDEDHDTSYRAKITILEEGNTMMDEAIADTPEQAVTDALNKLFEKRKTALRQSIAVEINVKVAA